MFPYACIQAKTWTVLFSSIKPAIDSAKTRICVDVRENVVLVTKNTQSQNKEKKKLFLAKPDHAAVSKSVVTKQNSKTLQQDTLYARITLRILFKAGTGKLQQLIFTLRTHFFTIQTTEKKNVLEVEKGPKKKWNEKFSLHSRWVNTQETCAWTPANQEVCSLAMWSGVVWERNCQNNEKMGTCILKSTVTFEDFQGKFLNLCSHKAIRCGNCS